MTVELVKVKSSNIGRVGYDAATRALRVEFLNGGVYDYADVDPVHYEAMVAEGTISPGKYFINNVRDQHKATKIEAPDLDKLSEEQMQEAAEKPREMPLYQSHKKVRALKIKDVFGLRIVFENEDFEPATVHADVFARYVPVAGDYLVSYEDGYVSVSPRKAFEEGYTLIEEKPKGVI